MVSLCARKASPCSRRDETYNTRCAKSIFAISLVALVPFKPGLGTQQPSVAHRQPPPSASRCIGTFSEAQTPVGTRFNFNKCYRFDSEVALC